MFMDIDELDHPLQGDIEFLDIVMDGGKQPGSLIFRCIPEYFLHEQEIGHRRPHIVGEGMDEMIEVGIDFFQFEVNFAESIGGRRELPRSVRRSYFPALSQFSSGS